jgi:hypothetical protein
MEDCGCPACTACRPDVCTVCTFTECKCSMWRDSDDPNRPLHVAEIIVPVCTTEQVRLLDIHLPQVPPNSIVQLSTCMINTIAQGGASDPKWGVGRISVKHVSEVVEGEPLYAVIDGHTRLKALHTAAGFGHADPAKVMVYCDIYQSTVDTHAEAKRINKSLVGINKSQ